MQIRTRLTLRFSLIVTIILVVFSFAIYYVSSAYREDASFRLLKSRALTEAKLFSRDVQEVDTNILKAIDKNSSSAITLNTIIVYNDSGKAVYKYPVGSIAPVISPDFIEKIRDNKEIRTSINKDEALWVYYDGKRENDYVYISGYDELGYAKLWYLAEVLIICCVIAGIITFISGYFYSIQVLAPVNHIIYRVKTITASNLNLRLKTRKGNDEIDRLSSTFNDMLNRLEEAFELKRDFISNASHELRTPLGVMMVQLEVALLSDRTPEEYKKVLSSLLDDIKNFRVLMNGLLELTEANMKTETLELYPMRIDELLWQAKSDLLNQHPNYKVVERYTLIPEDQKKLVVNGNELLRNAFLNIMNNGCKYSIDNQVFISLEAKDSMVTITCTDMGIGIPEEEVKKVFQPFYRGTNAKLFTGNGLGLALSKKIIELHKGLLYIDTKVNEYTRLTVILPSLAN